MVLQITFLLYAGYCAKEAASMVGGQYSSKGTKGISMQYRETRNIKEMGQGKQAWNVYLPDI